MLEPQYVLAPRLVRWLAYGELAMEPALGLVRVAAVRPELEGDVDLEYVQVRWRDEGGPGSAFCRYPAHRSFLVRMPAPGDRLLIRRGMDHAVRNRREVPDPVACLIAAHLHSGQGSALEHFMIDGSIEEQIFEELEVALRQRQYAQEWVHALTRYCLARKDVGPAWMRRTVSTDETRAMEWLALAGVDVEALRRSGDDQADRGCRNPNLLARKQIPTEMAAQLIDAALLLGAAFARKRRLVAEVADRLHNS